MPTILFLGRFFSRWLQSGVAAGFCAAAASAGMLDFADSNTSYRITIPEIRSSTLRRLTAQTPPQPQLGAVLRVFDSLGYFAPVTDTVAPDSIHIEAGPRWLISSLSISGKSAPPVDSIDHPPFPVSYDAAIVSDIGTSIARYYANHGYPYATTTVSIVRDTIQQNSKQQPGMAISFAANPDILCRFTGAEISGPVKTKPKQLAPDIRIRTGAPFSIGVLDETRELLLSRDYIADVVIGVPRPGLIAANGAAMRGDSMAPTGVSIPMTVADRYGLGLDGAVAFSDGENGDNRLMGSIDFSLLNLMGWGEKARLAYKGDATSIRLDLELSKVHWASLPLTTEGSLNIEVREQQYEHTNGRLRFLYGLRPRWRLGVGVSGQRTLVREQSPTNNQWYFAGGDLILERSAERQLRGNRSRGFALETGLGMTDRAERMYTRWHLDFSAGGQIPVFKTQAVAARVTANNLFTSEDSLSRAELYRTGGYRSIRGYSDDEFAFRNVAFLQFEYLVYFSVSGALYAFADGGAGFVDGLTTPTTDYVRMIGYGLGIRLPSALGTASIEWARSIDDTKSLGKVHIRIQNSLSSDILGRL